ncbi:patatin-like phospholipase family protein [Halomicronema sp. CCY15110]|uniref:patatin-like phospholipase family protein n=1 Tax=Halomicronema sp. CCY15110 TaxID=2767773 RepID=UPI001EF1BFA8|nr:patatin family protein [Halomicronema sp. CCY15110]
MVKTLGLALGSGGARGWAHIGVIRALEEAGIQIHAIAGSSIGAFVGAIYAADELDELEAFVQSLNWRAIVSYFDVVFPSTGLLDGNRIYDLLSEHLCDRQIEDTKIPFCCVATDLEAGSPVCLEQGRLADAVRASISMPGIFTPFQHSGRHLGDGGIVNPVPVDVARRLGVDVVLAVNLNHPTSPDEAAVDISADPTASSTSHQSDNSTSESADGDRVPESDNPLNSDSESNLDILPKQIDRLAEQFQSTRAAKVLQRLQDRYETLQDQLQEKLDNWLPEERQGPNIFDVIGVSLNVMEQRVTQNMLTEHPPEILLQPPLSHHGIFDFHQAEAIIKTGYECVQQQLPEIKAHLQID